MIDLCGNCLFFHLFGCPSEDFQLVASTGQCNCPECKHRAYFDAAGNVGHMAPSNANSKRPVRPGLTVKLPKRRYALRPKR
jgi:hypothetical protein